MNRLSSVIESPKFEHDCPSCTFLGTYEGHDLYHCMQGGSLPTVLARYGSDGPEYISGLSFSEINGMIAEAWLRADAKGLQL